MTCGFGGPSRNRGGSLMGHQGTADPGGGRHQGEPPAPQPQGRGLLDGLPSTRAGTLMGHPCGSGFLDTPPRGRTDSLMPSPAPGAAEPLRSGTAEPLRSAGRGEPGARRRVPAISARHCSSAAPAAVPNAVRKAVRTTARVRCAAVGAAAPAVRIHRVAHPPHRTAPSPCGAGAGRCPPPQRGWSPAPAKDRSPRKGPLTRIRKRACRFAEATPADRSGPAAARQVTFDRRS